MNGFPFSNILLTGIFVVCLLTTVTGALIAALAHRIVRSVAGLAICCVGLAGLYYFLHSPFLAWMEILIYVGAVCVTIVFAIMLAEPDEAKTEPRFGRGLWWQAAALVACGGLCWGLFRLSMQAPAPLSPPAAGGSVEAIGVSLLTTYSMAFELISLLLLVAILGAVAVARSGRSEA